MSLIVDSVSIEGLKVTHFEQLLSYIEWNEREGVYYGNKKYYDKRHKELKEWVESILEWVDDPNVVIPKKKEVKC